MWLCSSPSLFTSLVHAKGSDPSNEAAKVNNEKERARQAWEEMVANCGEVFSKYIMEKRHKPQYIREGSPENSISHVYAARSDRSDDSSTEEEYPMPKEAYMSDKELKEYRKSPQATIGS